MHDFLLGFIYNCAGYGVCGSSQVYIMWTCGFGRCMVFVSMWGVAFRDYGPGIPYHHPVHSAKLSGSYGFLSWPLITNSIDAI